MEPLSQPFVIVVGASRSGTSLTCQALDRLGYYFGPEGSLIEADDYNPRGYYEHQELQQAQVDYMRECFHRRREYEFGALKRNNVSGLEHIKNFDSTLRSLVGPDFAVKAVFYPMVPEMWEYALSAQKRPWVFVHTRRPVCDILKSFKRTQPGLWDDPMKRDALAAHIEWMNERIEELYPVATIHFKEWFEDAEKTMQKLAAALRKPPASVEGLLL